MGDTQQPQPAGTGATGAEVAGVLAEIQMNDAPEAGGSTR